MKRWSVAKTDHVENPRIDAFLSDVVAVCRKHGLSISHEDGHGAFEVVCLDDGYLDWLLDAHDCTE